jgi:putative radical SAM enzyme (TIGR03279 family)
MARTEGVHVERVLPKSAARRAGLKAGDRVIRINGHTLQDAIDLAYWAADPLLELEVQRGGRPPFQVSIQRRHHELWGAVGAPPAVRGCPNHCVFCFVDQMPPGLRPTLYVKDEDYRHSFLYGNYITLANISRQDLARIKKMALSPLYISVHATEPDLRARLLGRRGLRPILEVLDELIAAGIHLHTQAVICPGMNDGRHLRQTISDLSRRYPGVASLAVVPVGLTRFRDGLAPLRSVDEETAKRVLDQVHAWQKRCLDQRKTRFVFAADEWYLKAKVNFPRAAAYEGFPQLENGVGISRRFFDQTRRAIKELLRMAPGPRRIAVVSGELAAQFVRKTLLPLRKKCPSGVEIEVAAVPNVCFGRRVGVTGLLTGEDIAKALKEAAAGYSKVLVPEAAMRQGRTFIDDWTVARLARVLKTRVRIVRDADHLLGEIVQAP